MGALNVGQITLSPVAPVTMQDGQFEGVRVSAAATSPVGNLSFDNVSGQVQAVGSAGGITERGTSIAGTLTGGTLSVANLRFDLSNKTVVADLVGRKDAVGRIQK